MNARDRYLRCRAFARASKRASDELRAILADCAGFWNYIPGRWPRLDAARGHERHAYARLPEHVQSQLSVEGK